MKNKKYLLLLLLIPIILLIGRSFSLSINSEIKNVEIYSNNYEENGSFKLEKSVDWTEKGVAKITYNLRTIEMNNNNNYKDIILVIDNSNLMNEGKLEKAKRDSMEFINSFLEDLHNRVAVIAFDSNATIKSNFTNNKEELSVSLGTINMNGKSNYNNALLKVDELLRNYDKEDNKDLVVVLLTNGNPNEGVPNDKATYEMLKDKYPYININAIQYENTLTVSDGIKNVSDYQILAGYDNVLDEAILTSVSYDKFIINDVINNDYFVVNSIDDIKTNKGNVNLTTENNNQVISWSFNNFKSGYKAKMEVTINLKDEFKNQNGLFSTNKQTVIESKINNRDSNKSSNDTLIISNKYNLTYNLNKPSNCSIDPVASESYFVGDTVKKKVQSLYCDGYYVKNWLIKDEESDIAYISDSEFVMPSHNVTVNAIWTKSSIVKSMDGTIYEKKNTLYRVLQDAAVDGTYAKEYKGPHQDSNTKVGNKKIYHWYAPKGDVEKGDAITNMYHVKFANHCWRMFRTTDTGGVKLLYNGEYDETKKCGANRVHKEYDTYGDHLDYYNPGTERTLYFADDYRYDNEINKYVLINPVLYTVTSDNYTDFIGKYTCGVYTECESVDLAANQYYYENDDESISSALLMLSTRKPNEYSSTYGGSVIQSGAYFQYGMISPVGAGYMFGNLVSLKEIDNDKAYTFGVNHEKMIEKYRRTSINGKYYADSYNTIDYDSFSKYELVEPITITSSTANSDLIGKYYSSTSGENYYLYFISDADDNYVYIIELERYSWTTPVTSLYFGSSIIENDDGTYTIVNPVETRISEFANNYANYYDKPFCLDGKITCSNPYKFYDVRKYSYSWGVSYEDYYGSYTDYVNTFLIAKSRNGLQLIDTLVVDKQDYLDNYYNGDYSSYKYTCGNASSECTVDNIMIIDQRYSDRIIGWGFNQLYGSDVTWDGTKYNLVNTVEADVRLNNSEASNHHFFCLGYRETSCEKVGYLITTDEYIIFENGNKDINGVRKSMMENNINSSNVKVIIDEWFHKNISKYQDYLEDTVWCNDRKSIYEDGSWYKIDGNIDHKYSTMADYHYVYNYDLLEYGYNYDFNYVLSLKCENETDRFSMDNPKAQLKYPAALLTYNEFALLNNRYALTLPTSTFTLSTTNYGTGIIELGDGTTRTSTGYGLMPAISLKYGTEYISGDGTASNPYVVDTSEVDG